MKSLNSWIIGLLAGGLVLFGVLQFGVIPRDKAAKAQYGREQLEATTHDVNAVLPYKSKYMGDASNTMNMFGHLPLGATERTFQLFPEQLTVQVEYKDTALNVGKANIDRKIAAGLTVPAPEQTDKAYRDEVKKSLIYNSTVAFSLIDNLEGLIYQFTDVSYTVSRKDVRALHPDWERLLDKGNWLEQVQSPLQDERYVEETAQGLLREK